MYYGNCTNDKIKSKETSWLMSPAIFDPNQIKRTPEALATSSICKICGWILKTENVRPDEFPEILPAYTNDPDEHIPPYRRQTAISRYHPYYRPAHA